MLPPPAPQGSPKQHLGALVHELPVPRDSHRLLPQQPPKLQSTLPETTTNPQSRQT
jgi:hypothetical protein